MTSNAYIYSMSSLVINTNPHLNTKGSMLLKVAQATVASFQLEGISISLEEALKMARNSIQKQAK